MGANANAGKNPSMLFPFRPEHPCIRQYSDAHRTENIHRTATTSAMYLKMRIPTIQRAFTPPKHSLNGAPEVQ